MYFSQSASWAEMITDKKLKHNTPPSGRMGAQLIVSLYLELQ